MFLSSEALKRNLFGDTPVISLDMASRREEAKLDTALGRAAGAPDRAGGLDMPASSSVMASDFWNDRPREDGARLPHWGGNLFYLGTVGLIATSIIGIFFGAGFLLLLSSPDSVVASGPVASHRTPATQSPARMVGEFPASGDRSSERKLGIAPMKTTTPSSLEAARLSAGLPSAGPVADWTASEEMSGTLNSSVAAPIAAESSAGTMTSSSPSREAETQGTQTKRDPIAPAVSAVSPDPISKSSTASSQTVPIPRSSAAEISELLAQGDSRLSSGDVASARMFYERAAAAGDGRAALRLGATFDPAFLRRAGLRKVQGDAAKAQSWYSYAADRGAIETTHPSDNAAMSQDGRGQ